MSLLKELSPFFAFKGDPYNEEYQPTIFKNFHEIHAYEGKRYNIHLWDTMGQYSKLRPLSYVKANVILILFAFDGPDSLK
ncbi:hypothetical protein M9Y10_036428 [Tritrichomonas musculus]|uniref:Uncharacterized protein n=1 Tax=Tritrichomonas musculus TaxID=1915356 RepID=A0ABR2GLS9_9EUKA